MSVVLWVGYSSGHLPSSWPQTVDHTCGRHKSEHTLDFPTAGLTDGKEEIVREEKMLQEESVFLREQVMHTIPIMMAQLKTAYHCSLLPHPSRALKPAH